MSDDLCSAYNKLMTESSRYVIQLSTCGEMRTRSWDEGQVIVHINDQEAWLSINQKYYEGLLP